MTFLAGPPGASSSRSSASPKRSKKKKRGRKELPNLRGLPFRGLPFLQHRYISWWWALHTGILVSLCEPQFIDCFKFLEWIASLSVARVLWRIFIGIRVLDDARSGDPLAVPRTVRLLLVFFATTGSYFALSLGTVENLWPHLRVC